METERYVQKRGAAWQRLPKNERNEIILRERFAASWSGQRFMDGARVYFLQEPLMGAIKIGIARDIIHRMRAIQSAHPSKLRLLGICEGGLTLEKELHRQFAEDRLEGEWFKTTPRLLERIAEICPPQPVPAERPK